MNKTKLYTVTGMSCAGCVAAVQDTLSKSPGVVSVEVNLLEGRTAITYDDEVTSPQTLQLAVRSIGYDLLISDSVEEQTAVREQVEHRETHRVLVRLIVAAVLGTSMMIIGMHPHLIGLSPGAGHTFNLIAATVVYFFCAWDYHARTLRQLRHLTFTMDTLISMSITVAYTFSLVRYFTARDAQLQGIFGNSYFDVIGMIMTFVLLGKFIEERAKKETTESLRKLMALAPTEALRANPAKQGSWDTIPVSEIRVGDLLMLRRGDRVPVDGRLEETGSFDESSITGEPIPAEKGIGDAVFGGTISVGQVTTFRAEKVGADTLLGRIVDAVRQAQASKAPIQRIADRISGVFVPAIIVIALITLIAWSMSDTEASWIYGLYYSISVLVIACPCALGLATPTAIAVAMGKASEAGLLIRDAGALERLSKVTDIIFDKTGTLTQGEIMVVEDLWLQSSPELQALMVTAEKGSTHPIAQAIVRAYDSVEGFMAEGLKTQEVAGRGVTFTHGDSAYSLTNRYEGADIMIPRVQTFMDRNAHQSLVYFARKDRLIAILALSDEVKVEAPDVLSRLQTNYHVTPHILSGDTPTRARLMGDRLGIRTARGGLSPIDKKEYVETLQREGKVVVMVGDGINDSPALATADLSIALATGSDIATDVAQVTSVGGALSSIPKAIELSRKTVQIIRQNFFWAFFYNVIAIPLAAGVYAPELTITPMISAAAMACSSVCVVLNSLRLQFIHLK